MVFNLLCLLYLFVMIEVYDYFKVGVVVFVIELVEVFGCDCVSVGLLGCCYVKVYVLFYSIEFKVN